MTSYFSSPCKVGFCELPSENSFGRLWYISVVPHFLNIYIKFVYQSRYLRVSSEGLSTLPYSNSEELQRYSWCEFPARIMSSKVNILLTSLVQSFRTHKNVLMSKLNVYLYYTPVVRTSSETPENLIIWWCYNLCSLFLCLWTILKCFCFLLFPCSLPVFSSLVVFVTRGASQYTSSFPSSILWPGNRSISAIL